MLLLFHKPIALSAALACAASAKKSLFRDRVEVYGEHEILKETFI
jgi:hypothetical protein